MTGLSIIDTMATKDDLVDLRTEIKGASPPDDVDNYCKSPALIAVSTKNPFPAPTRKFLAVSAIARPKCSASHARHSTAPEVKSP